jgi:hypothetical protein
MLRPEGFLQDRQAWQVEWFRLGDAVLLIGAMNRSQIDVDGMIGNLAAVFDSRCDRIAEAKPDEDAREPVLLCRLREAGVRAGYRCEIVADVVCRRTAPACAPRLRPSRSGSGALDDPRS